MNQPRNGVLPKSYSINGQYQVLLFIKSGANAETYRVKGADGTIYFLKLFHYAQLPPTSFDEQGRLWEIILLQSIQHTNVVSYKDSGDLILNGVKYGYLVLDFIRGETLAERLVREKVTTLYDLKLYMGQVLQGLHYMHTQSDPIVHNEITLSNVMLDLSGSVPQPILIDFGYARTYSQPNRVYNKEGLSPFFMAPECFNHVYSPQSDLYSVGALMYQLVFGMPPWFKDVSKYAADRGRTEAVLLDERKKPLSFDGLEDRFPDYDNSLKRIIKKALHPDTALRFRSAEEFLRALQGDIEVEDVDTVALQTSSKAESLSTPKGTKRVGQGFAAIAGMAELKELLQNDVIDALNHPQEYERYGLSIPNGMLLYGPPGCGKTFFAQRLAEEVGFAFVDIKPSSLQSRYVNATQENIKALFEEAEKSAPTIIFMDELDALVPNREGDLHQMHANAVNELLAQMSDCGEKGIFVIGATNRPEKIDPAILRAGRLDKKIYLPPPDSEARKTLFQLYLKNRPLDFGIDYEQLAKQTENYVSADIRLLVDEAARKARGLQVRISMDVLETIIKETPPSVSIIELRRYEQLRQDLEAKSSAAPPKVERTPIGFKTNQ